MQIESFNLSCKSFLYKLCEFSVLDFELLMELSLNWHPKTAINGSDEKF